MVEGRQYTLKDFKLEKKVGEGAFGAVYKAKAVDTGEVVAVKKLKVLETDRKNFEGIIMEMRILCSIDHKNIVAYKGSFWDDDKKNIYIVMEFLGGGDLQEKIKKCKSTRTNIPESMIWMYFIQLLKGLKVLHGLSIIHRDIKSANCFLTEDLECIKLGDMNVSKITRTQLAKTQIGTPLYLSPQVWQGKTYDSKTDIWSLGVMLYEMCTLNYPFMGLNMDQLKNAVIRGRFAPLPGYLNSEFTKLITKMLQMDPTKRPSVDELLNDPIIKSKLTNHLDMTINDMKKNNLRLMDTIKIPYNIKQVNLPKKKVAVIRRANSVTDVRPSSARSNRDGKEIRQGPAKGTLLSYRIERKLRDCPHERIKEVTAAGSEPAQLEGSSSALEEERPEPSS